MLALLLIITDKLAKGTTQCRLLCFQNFSKIYTYRIIISHFHIQISHSFIFHPTSSFSITSFTPHWLVTSWRFLLHSVNPHIDNSSFSTRQDQHHMTYHISIPILLPQT